MEDYSQFNKKIVSSMIWRFMERTSVQVITFVLQTVLARLLMPEDYGLLAIVSVFISFSATLVNNGIANALIQSKNSDELDENTVFYLQLAISVLTFAVMYVIAPSIAVYYENRMLTQYLRVMSIIIILEALSAIQLARLRKNMAFRKSFVANFLGNIVQGAVGITMAYCGYGCWSLIVSQIMLKVTIWLALLFMVRWRPRLMFSLQRLRQLFSYSWKLSIGWMVGTLHQNVFALVIGKRFSTEMLGYYNRAQNVPHIATTTANETVSSVMFSALAQVQSDPVAMKQYTRRMMALTSLIAMPAMAGIAGVSRSFVYLVLTEKWAATIPMMKLFCISYGINIISTANMQSFNALGKSDVFMKMELIKRTLSLVVLLATSLLSIEAVVVGLGAMGVFSLVYNVLPNKRLLNYTLREQAEDILPALLPALAMYAVIIQLERLTLPHIAILLLQVVIGVVLFVLLALLLRIPAMNYVKDLLLSKFKHGKNGGNIHE